MTFDRRTALVLSGGGMFGAYQAGAYQAIAKYTAIDMVVGASVGSLNGWAIASGVTPADLLERWRDSSAGEVLRMYPDAGWRRGWFDASGLRKRAEGLAREFTPRMPFAVAAVEARSLRTKFFHYPNVSAEHLIASCSVPLFLPAVRIGNRRYMDGGLFDKLPVHEAVAMGATRVIAIDCSRLGPWWVAAGIDLVQALGPPCKAPQGVDLKVIRPVRWLGERADAVHWKRENAERWAEMGYSHATRTLII
jgi:NTE family protein